MKERKTTMVSGRIEGAVQIVKGRMGEGARRAS